MSNGYGQLGAAMQTIGTARSTIGNVLGQTQQVVDDMLDLGVKDMYRVGAAIHDAEAGEWYDWPLKIVGAVVGGIATGGSPAGIGAGWAAGGSLSDIFHGPQHSGALTKQGQEAWKEYIAGAGSPEAKLFSNLKEGYTVYSGMDMYQGWQADKFLGQEVDAAAAGKSTSNVVTTPVTKGAASSTSGAVTTQATVANATPNTLSTAMSKLMEEQPMTKEYLEGLGIDIYAKPEGWMGKAEAFWGQLNPLSDAEFRPLGEIKADLMANQQAQMERLREIMSAGNI